MEIKHPIILCGFTSCGKTTVGSLLADALHLPFYDTDQLLVQQNQMTIPEIFAKGGEALFRELEQETARQVCQMGPSVIATGGGMLIAKPNAVLLAQSGTIIYLNRSFENCYATLSRKPDRPLFQNHTKEEVAHLYQTRACIYQKYAAFQVKNDGSPQDTAAQIVKRLADIKRV